MTQHTVSRIMRNALFILPFLLVLIFSSCSDDNINLAGTTWTSAKDWYGKTRLSFEEGTPYLRPFFAISFKLKSFTTYNNEDLEYEWKKTISGTYTINDNIVNLVIEKDNQTIPCEMEGDIMYYSDSKMKLYRQ